jgi:hypothetical protein
VGCASEIEFVVVVEVLGVDPPPQATTNAQTKTIATLKTGDITPETRAIIFKVSFYVSASPEESCEPEQNPTMT